MNLGFYGRLALTVYLPMTFAAWRERRDNCWIYSSNETEPCGYVPEVRFAGLPATFSSEICGAKMGQKDSLYQRLVTISMSSAQHLCEGELARDPRALLNVVSTRLDFP